MTLLFQEDCTPESYEYFCKQFKAEVGIDFKDWKVGRTNVSKDKYYLVFESDDYKVESSADEPYWKLYKK